MTAETERFWSVTTLIGEAVPKPALVGWAARVTAERAYDKASILGAYLKEKDRDGAIEWLTNARWETSGSAAARGVAVHKIVEQYALGMRPEYPPEFEPYAVQIRRFLHDHAPEFLASEAPVYNPEYRYAGTMDGILKVGGRTVIGDMKTTDKGPDARSRPPYPEIALQLCAYSRCPRVGVDPARFTSGRGGRRYYLWDEDAPFEPMPKFDGAVALIVSPVDYIFKPVRIDDEVWDYFVDFVLRGANWMLGASRTVFGPDIPPPAASATAAAPEPPNGGASPLDAALTDDPGPEDDGSFEAFMRGLPVEGQPA